jgi:hypothetical protein
MSKIRNKLFLIQRSSISLVQLIRQIPMKQCHERGDPFSEQIINKLLVERNTSRVYRIVTSTEGNDPGPGDGETVRLGAGEFQESDVFGCAVVGVASYGSRGAICDFPGALAEGVPD